MKKNILYFMLFCVFFVAFRVIIPENKEEKLGEQYIFSFDERTIDNKKIVLFDNRGLENVIYYVIEFTGEQYVVYSYYFMNDHEGYIEKYTELSSRIVDYNYDQYMIKALDFISYGTYHDVMRSLDYSLENNTLYIIY